MSAAANAREARSHASRAAGCTRRAEADARRAESAYKTAASMRSHAAWITTRQGQCAELGLGTPAQAEEAVRSWERLGDTFLRSSFHNTSQASFYRELAGRYRGMAARAAASEESSARWLAARAALADAGYGEEELAALMAEAERFPGHTVYTADRRRCVTHYMPADTWQVEDCAATEARIAELRRELRHA
jgi:hypothetical protein